MKNGNGAPGKISIWSKLKEMGPAAIVTSAFVGPGTITSSTVAGANYGYTLLWTIIFSIVSLMIMLEMSARLGVVARKDLASAIAEQFKHPVLALLSKGFVLLAVVATCLAFQAGNMIGGSLGLADVLGIGQVSSSVIIALVCLACVWLGTYRRVEKVMLFFVGSMSLIFIVTMVAVRPNVGELMRGAFIPIVPEGAWVNTIALIGTTIIGIHLFMHSVTTQAKWDNSEGLPAARADIFVNILIGGIITVSIIVTSATVLYGSGTRIISPLNFSLQLEPVLGSWARNFGSTGLFAAGISSAIALPLTASFILGAMNKWEGGIENSRSKILGTALVLFGLYFAATNTRPTDIIIATQAISGFFLPYVAIFLMICANNKKLLGKYANNKLQNAGGLFVCVVTLILGTWGLYSVFSRFFS